MSKKSKPPQPEFKKGQQVWIAKWALSDGIKSATFVGQAYSNIDSLFKVVLDGNRSESFLFAKQLHETKEGAIIAADTQRHKRIKSLQKQITKLEQMSFLE